MDMASRPPRRCRGWVVAAVVAIVMLNGAAVRASGSGSAVAAPRVGRHGDCDGPSRWRLRVVQGSGVLSVRFTIAGGAPDQRWNLYLDRNGLGFFQGARVSGIDGFLRVRRPTADGPGIDVIRAAGHNVVTGEICHGRVRVLQA
jgi:hypothetical protein